MPAIILSIIALVIALVSAVAALLLWRSARRANEIAASMHSIEADRRHEEQTPEFDLKLVKQGRQDHVTLEVKLLKPAFLDEVVIRILDEANVDHRGGQLPPGVTEGQFERFVWGPWEFNSLAAAQVANNRTSRPHRFSRADGKESTVFDMVRTGPGPWMNPDRESWERQQRGPLRLNLECRRGNEKPWSVQYEISFDRGVRLIV